MKMMMMMMKMMMMMAVVGTTVMLVIPYAGVSYVYSLPNSNRVTNSTG